MKKQLQNNNFKALLFFIIGFVYFTPSFSQNFVWAKSFGGPTYDDWRATAIDASGNVIAVGSFSGTVDFDPGAGVFNLTSTAGGDDIFILKLTSAGNFVWAKRIGTSTDEVASDVICDASSNIYVLGSFNGTVDFDPGIGTANLTSAGNSDVCMFKLSSAGNYVWAKNMGGTAADWGTAIDIDASSNLYITGTFTGTADFNPSATVNNLVIYGAQDAFIGKYDLNGNYLWAFSIGGPTADYGGDVKVNAAGTSVFTTGQFSGTGADLSPQCSCGTINSLGASDVYIIKLAASSGGFQANAVLGGTASEGGAGIDLDASDNVYVCGQFAGACDMDPGPLNQPLGAVGSADAYVTKLTSALAYVWAKQFSGTSTESAGELTLDPVGNIYVTGFFNDLVDFDPSPTSTYTIQSIGSPNSDCYVMKLDNNGNLTWVKAWGSSIGDYSSDIDLDAQGNIYSIGTFWNSVDFDPGAGTYSLTAVGLTDGYIHKLSCTLPSTAAITSANYTLCAGTSTSSPLTLTSTAVEPGTTYGWSVSGAPSVSFSPSTGTTTSMSFTASSTFSVIVTATNACGTTSTIVNVITANPVPTVSGVASPTAVCTGSLLTLNGAGATSYTWSNGVSNNTAFTATTSQVYTVSGTGTNGCVGTGTINVTAMSNPTLTISGTNLICLNKPQTLTGSGATTYSWMPGSLSGNTISATPSVNTVYTLSGSGANGCKNSTTFTVNLVFPPTPQICMVTVDSLGVNNEIYWEKATYPQADSFIVFRETSTNVYKRIAAIHKSAFSMYTDTNRSIGPANGDPNLTYYKYKLQLRDSCGNYSAMSLWHETVFVQDQQNGNFNWNTYAIESSVSPVANYNLKRRDLVVGTETLVANTVGGLATDPNYANVWNSQLKWFVDAIGFNCNPTNKLISGNNQVFLQKVRTKSNQANDKKFPPVGIKKETYVLNNLNVFPNPAKDVLHIKLEVISDGLSIELKNVLGQSIYSNEISQLNLRVNTGSFAPGIYFVNILQDGKLIAAEKVVISE